MTAESLEWLVVGLIGAVAAAGLHARHARRRSRSPREMLSVKVIDGVPTTLVAARVSLIPGAFVVVYLAIVYGVITTQVAARGNGGLGLLVLVLPAVWLLVCAVLLASGRIGDGRMTLTSDGITQRFAGAEQSVRWDDITEVDFIRVGIDLHAPHVEVHRTAPVLWTGRTKRADGGIRLQIGDLHPDMQREFVHAVHVWIDNPQLRSEIGTSASVHRIAGPEDVARRAT